MQKNTFGNMVLCNDNYYGYVDKWIYENEVTWMEKTCATPYWTGMMLFSIDTRDRGCLKHNLLDKMYSQEHRVAFKGQLFSAPMDWSAMLEQFQRMESETHISLPVTGAVLAARVQIVIESGLTDLHKLLRQATVRRNIVVQLIRMQRDAKHPDFLKVKMDDVADRAKFLAPTDDPTIPNGLAEFFTAPEDDTPFIGVDKAATPAERIWSQEELQKDMLRQRPQFLIAQRDSDACKDVETPTPANGKPRAN